MSHPDNGSTTPLDMFISLPGKGTLRRACAAGTTAGIDAVQVFPAQAAWSQKTRPAAQPTGTSTSRGTDAQHPLASPRMHAHEDRARSRHPAMIPVEMTVSAKQQHKVKAVTAASEDDPGRLIHRPGLPAEGKCLDTSIRAGHEARIHHAPPKTRPINAAVWARTRQRTGWTEVLAGADTWH